MADETRVGRFTLDTAEGTWEWDDEVYRIHGLHPGSKAITTGDLVQYKHPEDRELVADALERTTTTGEPVSVPYRLLAADGVERKVVMVCEGGACDAGKVATVDGYFIDLTDDFLQDSAELVTEAVEASAAHRATIEQAKGCLMLAYGVGADQAFAMLRWWSRNKNVKVRELADRLVAQAQNGASSDSDLRIAIDALLHDLASRVDGSPGAGGGQLTSAAAPGGVPPAR